MNGFNLSEKEKIEAKKNGFILIGKTGSGKTTLLNVIFGKEIVKNERTVKSQTQKSTIYYYKLDNGNYISIMDTPGLFDSNKVINKNIDNLHLEKILKTIKNENIQIKGFLFLTNFQQERFDSSEQESLIKYNNLFPFKSFWNNIVIIFTHYYGDPNGDTKEELKKEKEKSFSEIIETIMNEVKNNSNIIKYKDLNIKYFNFYSIKKQNHQKKNIKIKNELDTIFHKLYKEKPLFSKIEIIPYKNYKFTEDDNKNFIGEVEMINYYDDNNKLLKEKRKVISKTLYKEIDEIKEKYNEIINELKKNKIDIRNGDWNSLDWENGICTEREKPKIYCEVKKILVTGKLFKRTEIKYEKNFDDIIVGWKIISRWRDGTNGEWKSSNYPLLKHDINFTFTSQRHRGEMFDIKIYLMKYPK